MADKEPTRDQKCIIALGHRGKPKGTLERLTEGERDALAAIWDKCDGKPGPAFAQLYGDFWAAHSQRWAEYLEANKASVAEADEPEADTEVVDE